nr:hypothetical protein [Anaerolineae bacterium]
MGKKRKSSLASQIIFAIGAALGAMAVVKLIQKLTEQETAERPQAVSQPAPRAIRLRPQEVTDLQATPVPIKIGARPAAFSRGNPGSIIVETLPSAVCSIEVVYSTGHTPNSLDTSPVTVGKDGQYTWTWDIGTGGTFAQVTVTVTAEGYGRARATLKVEIG